MKKLKNSLLSGISLMLCSSLMLSVTGCDNSKNKKEKNKTPIKIIEEDSDEENEEEEDEDDNKSESNSSGVKDSDKDKSEQSDSDNEHNDNSDSDNGNDKDTDKDSDKESDTDSDNDISNSDDIIDDPMELGDLVSQNPVRMTKDASDNYDALTMEALSGIWVDDKGVYFTIDSETNTIRDYDGFDFRIDEILDDGLNLHFVTESYDYSAMIIAERMPMPIDFFLPMYLVDDALIVGENTLYRVDSKKGSEYVSAIQEELVGASFISAFGDACFREGHDGIIFGLNISQWKFNDCMMSVQMDDFGTYNLMVRKINDNSFVFVDDYGGELIMTYKRGDICDWINGDYISWSFNSGMANLCTIAPGVKTYMSMDGKIEKAVKYKLYVTDLSTFYLNLGTDVLPINQRASAPDVTSYNDSSYNEIFIRRDTIFGQVMLYREDVVNKLIDNDFENLQLVNEADNVKMTVNILHELAPEDWKADYISVVRIDNADSDSIFVYEDSVGPILNIMTHANICDYEVVAEVNTEADINVEYRMSVNDDASYEYYDYTEDTLLFRYQDNENSEIYMVADREAFPMKPDTILTANPKTSEWAVQCDTGDILDLIDMDYIRDSVVEDDGTAIFWVSTVEELASATYYINALDLERRNCTTMFYIHLLNDIDLAGYNWVSLGNTYQMDNYSRGYQHMFQGIIFGNGYSIKNMHIREGAGDTFLSNCHLATVIGLTLENPVFEDMRARDILISDNSCITEVFDTKVIVDEQIAGQFNFSETGNSSINYFDCSFESINTDTGVTTPIPLGDNYESYFYNGTGSWVYDYYTLNGDYEYNAASEYKDYLKDRSKFVTGEYYARGESFEECSGYLDVQGWYDGNVFNTEFGFADW